RELDVPTHGTALVADPRATVPRSRVFSYVLATVVVTVAAIAIAFFQGRASLRAETRENGDPASGSGGPAAPALQATEPRQGQGPTGVLIDSLPPVSTVVPVDSLPQLPPSTASAPLFSLHPPGRAVRRAPAQAQLPHETPEPSPASQPYRPTEL